MERRHEPRIKLKTASNAGTSARKWRRHLRFWPLFWSLGSAFLFCFSVLLGWPLLWQGLLLMIPLMVTTTGLGWRYGISLIPLGLLMVWGSQLGTASPESWWFYLGALSLLLLGVISGQSLFSLWRASERRAKRAARHEKLLSSTVRQLQKARSTEAIYTVLPDILSDILTFTHSSVFVPHGDNLRLVAAHNWEVQLGFQVPLHSVIGRACQQATSQYVADTSQDQHFCKAPNAPETYSELALPLSVGGVVVAVLNIEATQRDAFSRDERATLETFANMAEEALLRAQTLAALEQQIEERSFMAELNHRLLRAKSIEEVAENTLHNLQLLINIEVMLVLVLREGRFQLLAGTGELLQRSDLQELREAGLPWGRGLVGRSWQEKRSIFIDDYENYTESDPSYKSLGIKSAAFVPVMSTEGNVQALLELVNIHHHHRWSETERQLLPNVADTLGLALSRATLNRELRAMLDIIRQLAQTDDPSQLYQKVVVEAVQLIGGCEAASLLVREGDHFTFKGVEGHDPSLSGEGKYLSLEDQQIWYGKDKAGFATGKPRIIRGDEVRTRSLNSAENLEVQGALEQGGNLDKIISNLCLPVTFNQKVIGILNLDSFTLEHAFDSNSLMLAESFAQQIAVIIRQSQYRKTLEQNVITDTLTGLGNRKGFNQQLELSLADARRYERPWSLIMMDLNNFKEINDVYGHQAGDEALRTIADTIRQERRQSDHLFRWGGDEFALILAETDRQGAQLAAERYAAAVATLKVNSHPLSFSIGVASFPEDGENSEQLLKKADQRMYQHKALV